MTSYHETNLGAYSGSVISDMDGYVHTSIREVLAGTWDAMGGRMTRDRAAEIAAHNRRATKEANEAIREWRQTA